MPANDTAPRTRATDWLSPARVAAIAVFASMPAKLLTQRIIDIDLWWHMRTGRYIVETKSIPRTDFYSYTAPGRKWVVQEWGSEVILHGIRSAFGLYGILVWQTVMVLAIYAVVARLIVRRMGTGIGAWTLLALTAYAGSINWTERPNLFSFLLFALTLDLLERRGRHIWWFLPITVLWANLHGMVILGIGLVALVAIAEGLKIAAHWRDADPLWAKRLGLVVAAAIVAVIANPAGLGLYAHAFGLIRSVGPVITEWASPNFHEPGTLLFLFLLLLTIAGLALHPDRPDPTDVALTLAFTMLALGAVRNLAVASMVIGMVAARWLPGAIAHAWPRPSRAAEVSGSSSLALGIAGLVASLGVLAAITVAGLPRSGAARDIVHPSFPIDAIDNLNRPGVRLLTRDVWAGLAIDRVWPNVRVYFDSRVDMYGTAHAKRYARTLDGFPDWQDNLDRSCTTHVLIRQREPLAQILALSPDWRRVAVDKLAVTFARLRPAPGCERFAIP